MCSNEFEGNTMTGFMVKPHRIDVSFHHCEVVNSQGEGPILLYIAQAGGAVGKTENSVDVEL